MTNQEAIEQLKLNNPFMAGKDKELFSQAIDKGIEALENQKTGHWVVYSELNGEWEGTKKYACDKCGVKVGVFKSNFCPNCGAKMEGESNE